MAQTMTKSQEQIKSEQKMDLLAGSLNFDFVKDLYNKLASQWQEFSNSFPFLSKVTAIAGMSTIALIARKRLIIWHRYYKNYPAGPVGLPIFGCFFQFAANRPLFGMSIGKQYPIVASVPFLFGSNMIYINNFELFFKLSKKIEFADRPQRMMKFGEFPPSFISMNRDVWIHRRKLFFNTLLNITDSKFLSDYVLNNVNNKILVPSIDKAIANNNGIWNPRESAANYAFNTIFAASFGSKMTLDASNKDYAEFVKAAKELSGKLVLLFIGSQLGDTVYNYVCDKYICGCWSEMHCILKKWINETEKERIERRNNINNNNDFIPYIDNMLNETSKNNNDMKMSQDDAIADILATFFTGTYTTSESIEYFLVLLAKNLDIQEVIYDELCKIFEYREIEEIINDNKYSFNMNLLNKCHYLRAFIEKGWKLKAMAGLPRQLKNDYKLEYFDKKTNKQYNYTLAKGSNIRFNPWQFHNDTTEENMIEHDWYKFDISEYLDSHNNNNKFIRPNKLNVFGYGLRDCVGQSLARKEVMFALAILLHKYKFYGPNRKNDTNFKIPNYLVNVRPEEINLTVEKRVRARVSVPVSDRLN